MDFPKLFEAQREFDSQFVQLERKEKLKKKFFALIVELGEVANESPATFKYWSSNPKGSTQKQIEYYSKEYNSLPLILENDPLLEELVDMLHFILSLGNELQVSDHIKNIPAQMMTDVTDLQMRIIHTVSKLYVLSVYIDEKGLGRFYTNLLSLFLHMSYLLGYKEEDLEKAYYRKNGINYERQENGY